MKPKFTDPDAIYDYIQNELRTSFKHYIGQPATAINLKQIRQACETVISKSASDGIIPQIKINGYDFDKGIVHFDMSFPCNYIWLDNGQSIELGKPKEVSYPEDVDFVCPQCGIIH
jgi:hypothetical protein